MPASYPSGFDAPADAGANLNTNPHSAMHNLTNDIVEAIEAELGLSPSGASATVAARFTADEALISKSYTVCTSGTRPSSPTEGDKIFETDTNKILVYSGSAWSTIGPVHGAWTAYTPTWSGTLGNGSIAGAYMRVGRAVTFRVQIIWGSTTSHAAATQTLTVPFTMATAASFGGGIAGQVGVNIAAVDHIGSPLPTSTTVFKMQTANTGGAWSNTTPGTFANGHVLTVSGTYEASADA